MKKILVKKGSEEIKTLNKHLNEAFGSCRVSTNDILSNKYIKAYIFKENNKDIGTLVVCITKNISYLMYLSVNKKIRNKGYGTKILKEYKKLSKGKIMLFETELIDPKSKDNIYKVRRREFYLRNGFKATGYGKTYFGLYNYEFLSSTNKFNQKEFDEVLSIFNVNGNELTMTKIDKKFHVKQLKKAHKIGVIFDFNGTLFNDDSANDYTWLKEINKYSKRKITDLKSFNSKLRNPKDRRYVKNFMKYFGYGNLTDEEADKIWIDKELIYRDYCKKHKMNKLAPGTKELTTYLYKNSIPYGIASMAPEMNFDFYYDYTDIGKYFNRELIIHDCDLYTSKVEMYKDAAKKLNVKINNVIVIEDSPKSIDDAIKAGVKKIIYINRTNRKHNRKEIIQEVKSLKDIDKNLIK